MAISRFPFDMSGQGVGFAAAAFDLGGAFASGQQAGGHRHAPIRQCAGAVVQFGARLDAGDILFHVLRRPTAAVGYEGELREDETEFAKEHHHQFGLMTGGPGVVKGSLQQRFGRGIAGKIPLLMLFVQLKQATLWLHAGTSASAGSDSKK